MDIEEFYDGDPRRRPSAEIELGADWHDTHGTRYEVNWVEDTGELYLMREPAPLSPWIRELIAAFTSARNNCPF